MKRVLYCYLLAALMDFIVFVNLPGNANFLDGGYLGGLMTILKLLAIPILPVGHFYQLCMAYLSGQESRFLLPVIAFFATFFLALWASKFLVRTSTNLNAESGEQ